MSSFQFFSFLNEFFSNSFNFSKEFVKNSSQNIIFKKKKHLIIQKMKKIGFGSGFGFHTQILGVLGQNQNPDFFLGC